MHLALLDYYFCLFHADQQDATERDDTHNQEEAPETAAEDSNDITSSVEESDDSPDLSEKLPAKNEKEEQEELEKKKQEEGTKVKEEVKVTPNREETQKEETSDPGEWYAHFDLDCQEQSEEIQKLDHFIYCIDWGVAD